MSLSSPNLGSILRTAISLLKSVPDIVSRPRLLIGLLLIIGQFWGAATLQSQVNCDEINTSALTTVSFHNDCNCLTVNGVKKRRITHSLEVIATEKLLLKGDLLASPAPGRKIRFKAEPALPDTTFPGDVTWVAPDPNASDPAHIGSLGTGPGTVGQFEKLELGIELDPLTEWKINNFIHRRPGDKLNPFDPDDIDIRGYFSHGTAGIAYGSRLRHGFFFQDFERAPQTAVLACCWDSVQTTHRFRIRFTPRQTGKWCYRIRVHVRGQPDYDLGLQTFTCIPSNPLSRDFTEVGPSNRYFQIDGQTWFPVGLNIPWPEYQYQQGWPTDTFAQFRNKVVGHGEYRLYQKRLTDLKKSGANSFRMLLAPWNFEIEYESLGNYTRRMSNARELDWLLEHCRNLDLRIHFNMQLHFPFDLPDKFGHFNWDWGDKDFYQTHFPALYSQLDTCIYRLFESPYCYPNEIPGVISPKDFLTNPTAKALYKQRLRYIIARWGYSPNIYLLELLSEVNNLGSQTDWDAGGNGCARGPLIYSPSAQDSDYPRLLNDWQREMCAYIKHTLQHRDHLLAVNYTGIPNLSLNQTDNCNILLGDSSYFSKDVDVWTYNRYEGDVFRLANVVRDYYRFSDPNTAQVYIDKPLVFSEMGNSNEMQQCDNGVSFLRAIVLGSFSGVAATPFDWHYRWNQEYWPYLNSVRRVMNQIDWNTGGWVPFRWLSVSNKVEILGLRTTEGPHRIIGVIYNRSFNQFTLGENLSPCVDVGGLFVPDKIDSIEVVGMIDEDNHFVRLQDREVSDLVDLFDSDETYVLESYSPNLTSSSGPFLFSRGVSDNATASLPTNSQYLPYPSIATSNSNGFFYFIVYRSGDSPIGLN